MKAFTATERTQIRRHAERGVYDREKIYSILDEGYLCNLGFTVEGQPYVIPTSYGRKDNVLYVHGSAASRMQPSPTRSSELSSQNTTPLNR